MAIDERARTCKELVELLTDYLEGALSSEDNERFEVHLANCDGCATYLQQMRKTMQALGNLGESSLSPQAKENLLRIFQNWKSWNEDATIDAARTANQPNEPRFERYDLF